MKQLGGSQPSPERCNSKPAKLIDVTKLGSGGTEVCSVIVSAQEKLMQHYPWCVLTAGSRLLGLWCTTETQECSTNPDILKCLTVFGACN